MTLYALTAANVLAEAGAPKCTELGFPDDTAMGAHVTNFLLPAAQDAVENYLHRTYADGDVPPKVKHVTLVLAALGLGKIRLKKMGLLVRVADYAMELSDPTIFTPELKAEIADFVLGRTGGGHTVTSLYKTREIKHAWDEE